MKTRSITLFAVALLALALLAFGRSFRAGSVTGTFTPRGSVSQVWLYSATDTIRGNTQTDGFEVSNVKAGTYTLMIDATAPYKPVSRTGIKVADGEVTNVGQVVMER